MERAREMLHAMVRIRTIEAELAAEYAAQEMRCPVHLCLGQEAPTVGVITALEKEDTLLSHHRAHGHYLARGGDLNALVAELYGRASGCSGGKGGSMHLIDERVNFLGSTSIVSGVIAVATGVGFSHKLQGKKGVSVIFFGDGATEEGLFYESLNFAALHQLPTLFVCENNFFSVYTPLSERQPAGRDISRIAEALGVSSFRVTEGNSALKVHDVALQALAHIRGGRGPALIEAHTWRQVEHCGPNPDDDLGYRPPEDQARWTKNDPLTLLADELLEKELCLPEEIDQWREEARQETRDAIALAKASPYPEEKELFTDVYAPEKPVEPPKEEPGKNERELTYSAAVNESLALALQRHDNCYIMGLGATDPKGIFGTTLNLHQKFGRHRLFDAPISENALTGVAVGAALTGMRPVLTHQRIDFVMMAMDQMVNNAAKWRYMFGGVRGAPITIRAIIGRGWGQGPQHSQNLAATFAHFPGLRVVAPTTPREAKGILLAAIASDDPVVVIEHRWLYNGKGVTPEGYYTLPLDKAILRRTGKDFTFVATMDMVVESIRAAEILARHGIDVEVIDLLSISPIDYATIMTSVNKTKRLLIADSGWSAFGVSAEVAAGVAERSDRANGPSIIRVGLPHTPSPSTPSLTKLFYPTARTLCKAVEEVVGLSLDLTELENDPAPHDVPDPYFSGPF